MTFNKRKILSMTKVEAEVFVKSQLDKATSDRNHLLLPYGYDLKQNQNGDWEMIQEERAQASKGSE